MDQPFHLPVWKFLLFLLTNRPKIGMDLSQLWITKLFQPLNQEKIIIIGWKDPFFSKKWVTYWIENFDTFFPIFHSFRFFDDTFDVTTFKYKTQTIHQNNQNKNSTLCLVTLYSYGLNNDLGMIFKCINTNETW